MYWVGQFRVYQRAGDKACGGRRQGLWWVRCSLLFPCAAKRELYVPPAPPEDEESIFQTIATGINFDKYDEIPVEVSGENPPPHITSFEECGFYDTTLQNITKCNYSKPTPVQKYAIPIVTASRDLMACAQTGSGKTVSVLYVCCEWWNSCEA